MSLTKEDLVAISHLINVSAIALEKRLTERFTDVLNERLDKLDDSLAIQTEKGLQEVRDRVNKAELGLRQHEIGTKKIRRVLSSV